MKHKLIIFDWDGTLMDSTDKIVLCMKAAAVEEGLEEPESQVVKNVIGLSLVPAIKDVFGIVCDELAQRLADNYKQAFSRHEHIKPPLFPGVDGLLKELQSQDRIMAVATGKARVGLSRAWQETNTGHFFQTSRCADEAESKPSPDMLEQILSALNLSAEEAVMVGDTSYDMLMAEQIGMERIAVSYGAHGVEQLNTHSPTELVHDVAQLHRVLCR